jgi:hypothetical protein
MEEYLTTIWLASTLPVREAAHHDKNTKCLQKEMPS